MAWLQKSQKGSVFLKKPTMKKIPGDFKLIKTQNEQPEIIYNNFSYTINIRAGSILNGYVQIKKPVMFHQ